MNVKLYNKLSIKLFLITSLILIITFSVHTYITVYTLKKDFSNFYMQVAFNTSDLIKRSTRYSMMHNKREDIYQTIRTIGTEQGVKRIRIYNKQGVITFSTDSTEIMKSVNMTNESCNICHDINSRKYVSTPKDSIRIFNLTKDERVLGLINPIRNEKDCYTSDCHAHSPDQSLTGVLDVIISMKSADDAIYYNIKRIIISSFIITFLISGFSGLFILILVNKPLKKLQIGIDELGKGNWDYRIKVRSRSEFGEIAREFNEMSQKLSDAYNDIKDWSENLNTKVEEKTKELKNVYEQIVQIEKLASLGKLSATVAHELNNPLEGILTYSKLISKRLKSNGEDEKYEKILAYLNLISEESARCGKIVKDLLLFSHQSEQEFKDADLVNILDKSVMLINHHLEINNITLEKQYCSDSYAIYCNPQKIQQAIISLLINAIEAMSSRAGGKIILKLEKGKGSAIIRITDEGTGIADKDLPHIFEPFFTTKESLKGTGLGLAVVYGIINSHKGRVEVEKTSNSGTTFKLTLPEEPKIN